MSVLRFDREMWDNQSFQLTAKHLGYPTLKFGLITIPNDPAMPRIYLATLDNPRGNKTIHFHLTCFNALSKTVIKFYKYKIVGDNYTLGRNSYITFCNTGPENKTLQISVYLACSDTSVDFFLDTRMQRQFITQYRPMYKYSMKMMRKLMDDDIVLILN